MFRILPDINASLFWKNNQAYTYNHSLLRHVRQHKSKNTRKSTLHKHIKTENSKIITILCRLYSLDIQSDVLITASVRMLPSHRHTLGVELSSAARSNASYKFTNNSNIFNIYSCSSYTSRSVRLYIK